MLDFDARQKLPTLLLIDDDMIGREVMATVLTMNGYHVYTAESGLQSLEHLQAGVCRPDVILMDAQMPGLSGVELIHALRERTSASVYTISASQPEEAVTEAADGFLLKPFDANLLSELLRSHRRVRPEGESLLAAYDEPVVNQETLAQLRVMMPARAVREIFVAVVVDLHRRAKAIGEALERADLAETRRLGHGIKGGCGMAGAAEAARIGALLESSDDLDNSRALLCDLSAATERLERMLEAEFTV